MAIEIVIPMFTICVEDASSEDRVHELLRYISLFEGLEVCGQHGLDVSGF